VTSADHVSSAADRRAAGSAALIVVVVAFSFQTGSALAARLIGHVGIVEAVWLRTAFAAAMLAVVRRGVLRWPEPGHRLAFVALTVSLAAMNLSFYGAISHAPLGIVVAVEFLGPLSVAVIGTRRLLDLVWVALAAVGVVLLAGPTSSVSALGLGLALTAATCWGSFVVLAKRVVTVMDPLPVVTLMLAGSTLLLTPLLATTHPSSMLNATALLLGLSVALLSSGFPYVLEFTAIRRVRAATYGVLVSIEPAVAALMGFVILGQHLSLAEGAAIAAVIAAAAGASWTSAAGKEVTEITAA
jgi:inner membrane transporter RhtA